VKDGALGVNYLISMNLFMNPFHTGQLVIFQVRYSHSWVAFEMIPFLLLAILGGLMGTFFIKMNIKMCAFRKRSVLANYPILEVIGARIGKSWERFLITNPNVGSNF